MFVRHKLVDKKPVPIDPDDFSDMSDDKHVGLDKVEGVWVSTVFLPYDHGHDGKSMWFETMLWKGDDFNKVFEEGKWGEFQERYETWEEAEAGHKRVCAMVKANPDKWFGGE